jgi:hypothetical protein
MNKIILQPFTEVLAAGEVRTIHAYSQFITILENTAANEINIGIGDMQPVQLRAGLQFELPQDDAFSKIILYNQAAVQTTVSFILSIGRVFDNRLTISGTVFSNLLTATQGPLAAATYNTFTTNAGAYKSLLAANANRVSYSVENLSTNAQPVYIGYDNTVTASKYAMSLLPGESISEDKYRGPVYVFCTAAQAIMYSEK